MIPNAGCYDTSAVGDPAHLAKTRYGIGHEVHDELGQRSVERVVREGKIFRRSVLHGDRWITITYRGDERFRRIGCRDVGRFDPSDELGRQCTWTATDIDHPLPGFDRGEVCEERCQGRGVPAHELVVGASGDVEAHDPTLRGATGEYLMNEVLEQGKVIAAMAEQFRVPLHTQHGRRGLELDRLDVAVMIVGHRSNTGTEAIDDLMVHRVDTQR